MKQQLATMTEERNVLQGQKLPLTSRLKRRASLYADEKLKTDHDQLRQRLGESEGEMAELEKQLPLRPAITRTLGVGGISSTGTGGAHERCSRSSATPRSQLGQANLPPP